VTLTASGSTQQNPYGNGLTNGFLWYKDGSSVVAVQANAGSNQISSLTFRNVDPTNAGSYAVVCTNYWGSATSSPAILTVTSSSPPAPQLKTTFALPGGPFVLGFTNNPGTSFTVLYSSNVSLPLGSWTPLGPATEISPGQYQFSDAGVPTNSQRFFRVRSP
jgi:hypothetical protein